MRITGKGAMALLIVLAAALAGCSSRGAAPPPIHRKTSPSAQAPAPAHPVLAASLPVANPLVVGASLVQHPLLTQVQMVGPFGGWAIEQLLHGTSVARTTDGGRHWTTVYVTPQPAIQLSATDMQTAYVLLSACTDLNCTATQLMVTHNGGSAWQSVYAAQDFSGKAVSFVSATQGYLGGTIRTASGESRGDLLVTKDGGQVWTQLALPCASGSFALSFPSVADGFLLCGGQTGSGMQAKTLYRTSDSGAHWAPVSSVLLPQTAQPTAQASGLPLPGIVRTVFFLNSLTGWMGLDRGGIYETTDGGVHWHPVWQPPFAPGADNAFSVGFTDPSHGWVLYGEGPPLSTTANGGRTWTVVYPPLSPSTALSFSSPRRGIGAGWVYDGTLILSTQDAGVHWTMAARAPVQISGIAVVGPRTYLVLGQNALYRTEDGGTTWAASASPAGYYPATLGMLNADSGYLVAYKPGAGRALFSTDDGGASWHAIPAPFSPSAIAVSPASGLIALGAPTQSAMWVHGFEGKMQEVSLSPGTPYLWRMKSGSWWPVRLPDWSKGQAMPTGLRTGPGGLLWAWSQTEVWLSTDHGTTWQPLAFGDQLAISDVSFSDAMHGWILASGNVYATSDGGQTWREISGSPTY